MTDLKTLLQGKHDCPCGREHTCPIEAVVIGEDTYCGLGEFAFSLRSLHSPPAGLPRQAPAGSRRWSSNLYQNKMPL